MLGLLEITKRERPNLIATTINGLLSMLFTKRLFLGSVEGSSKISVKYLTEYMVKFFQCQEFY
jgi:hypothetical protein